MPAPDPSRPIITPARPTSVAERVGFYGVLTCAALLVSGILGAALFFAYLVVFRA